MNNHILENQDVQASYKAPALTETSISMSYMADEVPDARLEKWLAIYYHDGTEWMALETLAADEEMNYVAARTQGEGLYVLGYDTAAVEYAVYLPTVIR